ncbi:MarR family transcriptional regulator [Aliikangiella marina]|uniref:MarR family transcriptional regulator n=1 Tax=Aliikangiella marina TaxID=1712262 RepID=A0A545T4Q3_9GAMM|nr:MarR family transcriptional regulator [Aliikangiella marina]TQV72204.1 MarR family transcriptional regulator [Aliikangiella marina]
MTKKRRLIYQINVARHAMMKYLDAGSRETLGVSATQLTALMALRENGGLLMSELAEVLMLDKSAVTGLAKRMIANELIVRVPSENDARASLLKVTAKGNEKIELGLKLLKGVNKQISEGFTEDELVIVSRFLEHLRSTFSND